MNIMKKNIGKRIFIGAIIITIWLFFLSPPIAIVKYMPMIPRRVDDLVHLDQHLTREQNKSVNRSVFGSTNFEYIYFLNFQFWKELEIHQVEIGQTNQGEVKKNTPFIYAMEFSEKNAYHYCYELRRGNDNWYFDLYASDNPVLR